MSRPKRPFSLHAVYIDNIDRQASLLTLALRDAQMRVKPFSPHYEALQAGCDDLRKLLNLLNDRPADYREPHRGHGGF